MVKRYLNIPILSINMVREDDNIFFRIWDDVDGNTCFETDSFEDLLDIVHSNVSYYSFNGGDIYEKKS